MNTPIWDFVTRYCQEDPLRLHMPGHKGRGPLGAEARDITEVPGADVLYSAAGIIRESEENAAALFGTARTLYSAEGSSLCIRAMLYLALLGHAPSARRPVVLAARNAHRAFLTAAALLDLDVVWLWPQPPAGYLSCFVDAGALERTLTALPEKPVAVYLTSPDYLGNLADLPALSAVCRRRGVPLLVDNAHGAYLKFLPESLHPMDLGADLCCDSAHKTLPVLTGGAYLHIAESVPGPVARQAEAAMALFASTSPSYLILQSLDLANRTLAEGYRDRLADFTGQTEALKDRLARQGWRLSGEEPLKLTLAPKSRGYTGIELEALLRGRGIGCEYADPDCAVCMLTPDIGAGGLARLETALAGLPPKPPVRTQPPPLTRPEQALSVRAALLSPQESCAAGDSAGRILAMPTVSCPPAVPILAAGERIDGAAVELFEYYGVKNCLVVME